MRFPSKKLYIGFNKENEKVFPVENGDGYKVLDGYGTESMSNFAVTQSGNYVGGYFMDVCTKDISSPATGFFLRSYGKILFNGNIRKSPLLALQRFAFRHSPPPLLSVKI